MGFWCKQNTGTMVDRKLIETSTLTTGTSLDPIFHIGSNKFLPIPFMKSIATDDVKLMVQNKCMYVMPSRRKICDVVCCRIFFKLLVLHFIPNSFLVTFYDSSASLYLIHIVFLFWSQSVVFFLDLPLFSSLLAVLPSFALFFSLSIFSLSIFI